MSGSDRGRFSLETHIKNPAVQNSGMTSILSLTNVTKEDESTYECIVTNPYGRTSHKIKLLVQGKVAIPIICDTFCSFGRVKRDIKITTVEFESNLKERFVAKHFYFCSYT